MLLISKSCQGSTSLSWSYNSPTFSVYYSQGNADSIAAEMKEGKSEVVGDQADLPAQGALAGIVAALLSTPSGPVRT
jgi:hypothetical protein